MNEKWADKTDGVSQQQLPPISVMSGQLPGVNVTTVHLMVLASSIPVCHLSPPLAAPRLRSGHLPVLCAHKGLRGTVGKWHNLDSKLLSSG